MRRASGIRLLLALAVLSVILCIARPASAQDLGNIVGQIKLIDGSSPTERVMVVLQTRGLIIGQMFSDTEGHFTFYRLPANMYHVVIDADGYYPIHEQVVVAPSINQNNYVRVILRPVEKKGKAAPPSAAAGANPHMVSATDYKKFPREAIKEFEAGVKADQQGKSDKAIHHYRRALELAPDYYPARNNLGSKFLSSGDFAAAEAEFAQVIRMNPNDPYAYFNLGNVFYLTRRYAEAARTLEEGLKKDPASAFGHFLMGSVALRTGDLASAELHLRRARESDPGMASVRLELANFYLRAGKNAEAVNELKGFIEQFPRDPMLPRVKELLKKLESQKYAPLPEKVKTAKTVYMENQSTNSDAFNHLYEPLSAWGRWKIVAESSQADLRVILTRTSPAGERRRFHWFLVVTEPKSDTPLLYISADVAIGSEKGLARLLVKKLRERIEMAAE